MTHIFERIMVHCPYAEARRYVHDDALRAVPRIPPFVMELERAQDPLRFDERLRVRWTPKAGAPYPQFDGEIVLRAERDFGGAVLELSGDYAPPFGSAGRAFDLLVGARIASATARNVLRSMAEAIERQAR